MICAVQSSQTPDLLHIIQAAGQFRLFSRLVQRRQQHGRENRDDRNNNEEFN